MQTFWSLFEPDCFSSSFALPVLNALFPGTRSLPCRQEWLLVSLLSFLACFFWLFSGSCFPLPDSPTGEDFCTRLLWSPPNHREIHMALLEESCDILERMKGKHALSHIVFQEFCLNLKSPGSGWTHQLYFGGVVSVQNFALYTQGLRTP